jgi:peptidoglycan/LPS O-acetylase OafA/YrhL
MAHRTGRAIRIMKYRADIDGLRAVAVVPVVLFHAGVPGVSGGFVGVDVFFVISGFLICGMIDEEVRRGSFSLANFYKRRILRIFPALVAMLIVSSMLAYFYFLPVELKDFSATLASAVASVSNIYFASTAGYFDAQAATKPLLHTWSLGVEEQFYVIAPPFMLLAYCFFRLWMPAVFALATVASLAINTLAFFRNPDFAFYLTPCRAWELALGALLAFGFFPLPATAPAKTVVGYAGLILIAAAVFFGSAATPLPVIELAAAGGAAMIIGSSESGVSPVGRLLSLRPAVLVGLISYSLYLWHWPIFVFQRSDSFLLDNGSGVAAKTLLIAFSFGAAYLSWRYIETPFRRAAPRLPSYAAFAGAGAAMVSLSLLALLWIGQNGVPSRFTPQVVSVGSYLAYDPSAAFRGGSCYIWSNRQHYDAGHCLQLSAERPNYLLLGDSHSAHLWPGLSAALPNVNLMQLSASMCRPVVQPRSLIDFSFCPRLMRYVFDDFLVNHKVDRVLLSATWKDDDIPALARTLDMLVARGIDVVVFGPIVEYDRALPRLLADEIRYRLPRLASDARTPGIAERDRRMAALVAEKGARHVSVYDAVCPLGVCTEYAVGEVPLQFDAGHLTREGSLRIGRLLARSDALSPHQAAGQ